MKNCLLLSCGGNQNSTLSYISKKYAVLSLLLMTAYFGIIICINTNYIWEKCTVYRREIFIYEEYNTNWDARCR